MVMVVNDTEVARSPERVSGIFALLLVGGVGLLIGGFGAYAYYSDVLRPLSHVLGPWILLAVIVSARQDRVSAVARSTVGLVAAVVAFYVGKDVMYAIEYPGAPYSVNLEVLALWFVFALIGGGALGLTFHRIGQSGWPAAAATAAALGLLVGDVLHRTLYRQVDPVLLVFLAVAVGMVLLLAQNSRAQWSRTAALTVPAIVLGLAVAFAPDVLERLVFVGF